MITNIEVVFHKKKKSFIVIYNKHLKMYCSAEKIGIV